MFRRAKLWLDAVPDDVLARAVERERLGGTAGAERRRGLAAVRGCSPAPDRLVGLAGSALNRVSDDCCHEPVHGCRGRWTGVAV